MNRRIFPLNQNVTTWFNYSNYLNWIGSEIQSLFDYLIYWNPDFKINGSSLFCIESNTGNEVEEKSSETIKSQEITLESGETLNIFDFSSLKWREGQLISLMENAYIKLKDFSTLNTIENLEKEHYIEKAKPYTVYFPKSWTHWGVQSSNNLLLQDPSFYFKMSQPIASLYLPTTLENKIIFNCFENGQRVAGTNIFTALEFSPSRYFLTIKNNAYWRKNAIVWNEEGAYWDNIDSEPLIHISNTNRQIWSNNYPLMHECYIRKQNNNSFEEFIFDNDFSTEITNIANHSTVLYNINAKNITSNETESWNDFVYVKII